MSATVEVERLFDEVAERLLSADASVERGRMFGSTALKRGGKVFALCSRDEVVGKLPAERRADRLDRSTDRRQGGCRGGHLSRRQSKISSQAPASHSTTVASTS